MKDLQTAQYVISKVGEAGGAVIRGLSYKTERDGDASIARQFELREEAQDIKYGAQESAYLYQLAGVKNATAIASVNAMTSSTGPRGNYNRGNPVKV
ncbi:MAG: hypothetical protein COV46_00390 [Deltaproteobacteria bacterium CG11_big_fil_rev_8_21_14_0_20_49_13]|nr:MAG: hypothetical protein COV46_00390 [Deltaproteobacteria bacterium CG11_big_fil_rev_8_21_14_0_20_49_13]